MNPLIECMITSLMGHDTVGYGLCDWLNKFYGFSCFQLLYMTLTINKMDGRGLVNTAHHECLPKKTKVTRY